MKNIIIISLILSLTSCIDVAPEIDVDQASHDVVIVEFGELSFIDDAKTYGNFEIQVPEIDQDVMEGGAVLAFIERSASEERPQRWSQFPQYNLIWKEIGDTTFSYLSYGEGFVRISLQSEISVEGVADTFKGQKLKLVIFK